MYVCLCARGFLMCLGREEEKGKYENERQLVDASITKRSVAEKVIAKHTRQVPSLLAPHKHWDF